MEIKTEPKNSKGKAFTLDEVFVQVASSSSTNNNGQGQSTSRIVLTPVSSEACLRHGIDPDYLRKRDLETFYETGQTDIEIQRLKYETYEYRRHELMEIASKEKERILRKLNGCDKSVSVTTVASLTPSAILREQEKANSTLIEMEEKRLKKAKEKQKRELLQLLQYEQKNGKNSRGNERQSKAGCTTRGGKEITQAETRPTGSRRTETT